MWHDEAPRCQAIEDTFLVPFSKAARCGSSPNCPLEGPPQTPLQLEDPSLKPQPFPLHLLPPTSWLFLQCSGRVRSRLMWGRPSGVEGEGLQAARGARPTSGGTRPFPPFSASSFPLLHASPLPTRNSCTRPRRACTASLPSSRRLATAGTCCPC